MPTTVRFQGTQAGLKSFWTCPPTMGVKQTHPAQVPREPGPPGQGSRAGVCGIGCQRLSTKNQRDRRPVSTTGSVKHGGTVLSPREESPDFVIFPFSAVFTGIAPLSLALLSQASGAHVCYPQQRSRLCDSLGTPSTCQPCVDIGPSVICVSCSSLLGGHLSFSRMSGRSGRVA